MLHVNATVSDEQATVIDVFDSREAANRARIRSGRASVETLPVQLGRPNSRRPKRGDVLATMTEASGLVAVADVTDNEDTAYGLTFAAWLAAADRSDSASDYDLRAAWRAGESPGDYR